MFYAQQNPLDLLPILAMLAIIWASLVAAIVGGLWLLWFYRRYERAARQALDRIYADHAVRQTVHAGDVILKFPTYHGLLFWFSETNHEVALSPRDARSLLSRLVVFTFTWGPLAYGFFLILPLTLCNYFTQRRSIARQAEAIRHNNLAMNMPLAPSDDNPYAPPAAVLSPYAPPRPSIIFRVAALVVGAIAGLLLIGCLVMLIEGQGKEALPRLVSGLVMAAAGWFLWKR